MERFRIEGKIVKGHAPGSKAMGFDREVERYPGKWFPCEALTPMPLSRTEIRRRATGFAKRWEAAHNEDADAKPFWGEFFDFTLTLFSWRNSASVPAKWSFRVAPSHWNPVPSVVPFEPRRFQ